MLFLDGHQFMDTLSPWKVCLPPDFFPVHLPFNFRTSSTKLFKSVKLPSHLKFSLTMTVLLSRYFKSVSAKRIPSAWLSFWLSFDVAISYCMFSSFCWLSSYIFYLNNSRLVLIFWDLINGPNCWAQAWAGWGTRPRPSSGDTVDSFSQLFFDFC